MRSSVCKESMFTTPIVIYSVKNFQLLDAFNENLEVFHTAGLIPFWRSQYLDDKLLNVKKAKHPKVLTLQHLIGCFYILFFGLFISLICFLFEMFLISFHEVLLNA